MSVWSVGIGTICLIRLRTRRFKHQREKRVNATQPLLYTISVIIEMLAYVPKSSPWLTDEELKEESICTRPIWIGNCDPSSGMRGPVIRHGKGAYHYISSLLPSPRHCGNLRTTTLTVRRHRINVHDRRFDGTHGALPTVKPTELFSANC